MAYRRLWNVRIGALVLTLAVCGGCTYFPHASIYWADFEIGDVQETRASWIDPELAGRVGAFGEAHDPKALTAGHPALPYGTMLRVTNLDNGRATLLRVTDRARERSGKRLNVSYAAAERLRMVESGVAAVRIEPILSQTGVASWYGSMFHGRPTSNGETYDQNALTAAHRFLPFGTIVRVTHLGTQKSVLVRINDRGGFIKGRVIDLSRRAARQIGILESGIGRVRIEIVRPPAPRGASR